MQDELVVFDHIVEPDAILVIFEDFVTGLIVIILFPLVKLSVLSNIQMSCMGVFAYKAFGFEIVVLIWLNHREGIYFSSVQRRFGANLMI